MTDYRAIVKRLQSVPKTPDRPEKQEFKSEAIPFGVTEDGRRFLTATQLVSDPYLMKFYRKFRACFRQDLNADIVWFEPENVK